MDTGHGARRYPSDLRRASADRIPVCYGMGVDLFADDPILPAEPDELEVLHDREYRVRAYRKADDLLMIRAAVRDQKPPGLYLEIDPDPLTVHHMQIEVDVAFPSLEIVRAEVVFESHPHEQCTVITTHYGELVGLSIARGFTHKVRELFGGPRGCTHTTALLQAMAPVAVQCFWSMQASTARRAADQSSDVSAGASGGADSRSEARRPGREMWAMNLNTCHVWAEDGEVVRALEAGEPMSVPMSVPVFLRKRLDELGLDAAAWTPWMRG